MDFQDLTDLSDLVDMDIHDMLGDVEVPEGIESVSDADIQDLIETQKCRDPRRSAQDVSDQDLKLLARTARLLADSFALRRTKASFPEFFRSSAANRQCVRAWLETVRRIAPARRSRHVPAGMLRHMRHLSAAKMQNIVRKLHYHQRAAAEMEGLPAAQRSDQRKSAALFARYATLVKRAIGARDQSKRGEDVESQWATAKQRLINAREAIRMRKARAARGGAKNANLGAAELRAMEAKFSAANAGFPTKAYMRRYGASGRDALAPQQKRAARQKIRQVLRTYPAPASSSE